MQAARTETGCRPSSGRRTRADRSISPGASRRARDRPPAPPAPRPAISCTDPDAYRRGTRYQNCPRTIALKRKCERAPTRVGLGVVDDFQRPDEQPRHELARRRGDLADTRRLPHVFDEGEAAPRDDGVAPEPQIPVAHGSTSGVNAGGQTIRRRPAIGRNMKRVRSGSPAARRRTTSWSSAGTSKVRSSIAGHARRASAWCAILSAAPRSR
jgi:hypothetical protein